MGSLTQLHLRSPNPPRLVLCDERGELVSVWTQLFDALKSPQINIYRGEFGDLAREIDAIVIPMNSHGIMEVPYLCYFGEALQKRIQAKVRRQFQGKMLVGKAFMVSTHNKFFPYAICVPNAPVSLLPGKETASAYLSTRAIFDLWRFGRLDRKLIRRFVKTIAIPGLGMSDGQNAASVCARQQFRAFQDSFSLSHDTPRRSLSILDRLHDPKQT